MSEPIEVSVVHPLSDGLFATLVDELAQIPTLSQVVTWGAGKVPIAKTVSVVIQDEFAHDVIFSYVDNVNLAFDCT